MIIRISDNAADRHATPEKVLMQSVVYRAFLDTEYTGTSKENILARDVADSWLRRRSADFCAVCHLAGLDPEFIRDAYVSGRVNFDALRRAAE